MLSTGEHEKESEHSPLRNCGMSTNHPESAKPRTSTPGANSDIKSATRSRFIKTPVPPALQKYKSFCN